MFSRFSRGRQGPHILSIRDPDAPIRLDNGRLVAWAKALGHVPETGARSLRPHRGQLPDVDVSLAEPAECRPGFFLRWTKAIFAGTSPNPMATCQEMASPRSAKRHRSPILYVGQQKR
jgi:hypothetical protein